MGDCWSGCCVISRSGSVQSEQATSQIHHDVAVDFRKLLGNALWEQAVAIVHLSSPLVTIFIILYLPRSCLLYTSREAVSLLTLAAKAASGARCDVATTSIWRVNGWLGKVLIYIENPDKTENPDFFEKQDMDGKEAQGLEIGRAHV